MIDLIVINKQLNMKRLIIVIIITMVVVMIATVAGMNFAHKKASETYIKQLDSQVSKVE